MPTFAAAESHVVSVTVPYDSILGFLDISLLLNILLLHHFSDNIFRLTFVVNRILIYIFVT
jgi:hypothetical protein